MRLTCERSLTLICRLDPACLARGLRRRRLADEAGTTTAAAETTGAVAGVDLDGRQELPHRPHRAARRAPPRSSDTLAAGVRRARQAGVDYDHARLLSEHARRGRAASSPTRRSSGSRGIPTTSGWKGVVAGTPSLAEFDVIIDAGSSAAEDPESAVPFDLNLPDGRVLRPARELLQPDRGGAGGGRFRTSFSRRRCRRPGSTSTPTGRLGVRRGHPRRSLS